MYTAVNVASEMMNMLVMGFNHVTHCDLNSEERLNLDDLVAEAGALPRIRKPCPIFLPRYTMLPR